MAFYIYHCIFCIVASKRFFVSFHMVALITNDFKHNYLTHRWDVNRYSHSLWVDMRLMSLKRYFTLRRSSDVQSRKKTLYIIISQSAFFFFFFFFFWRGEFYPSVEDIRLRILTTTETTAHHLTDMRTRTRTCNHECIHILIHTNVQTR